MDQFTPTPIKGLNTHNASAPANDQISVIPGIATAAIPSYVEGNEVKTSIDLNGAQRTLLQDAAGTPFGTDSNPLVVITDATPAGTQTADYQTEANVASGAQVDIDSTPITDTVTAELSQFTISSSVRVKATLQLFDGSTATDIVTVFVDANFAYSWSPKVPSTCSVVGDAGQTAAFRLVVKNMDNLRTADVYATFEYNEKA